MKATIVVNSSMPIGLIANTAAVLGVSLGGARPEIIGHDVVDASGTTHPGITGLPIPILSADDSRLKQLVLAARTNEELQVVPFNDIAQKCRSYSDYEASLSTSETRELSFLGVLLVGTKRSVSSLVGSLPLLK
ncbi:MAG: DUF2000 family protein [Spirochaetes bacterium]|jgi:hypothetical protein|nr:DUF2000 family protein [Spirochaetota bacterium]